jgi:hypothetical protein
MICLAKNGFPVHASIIDADIENCEHIMSGIKGDRDISLDGTVRIASGVPVWKSYSIRVAF